MAFATSSVSAGQLLAQSEDAPCIFADNHMRDVGTAFWSGDGTSTGTDYTDIDTPFTYIADGFTHFGCESTQGSTTAHHFIWSIDSSVVFDSIFVKVVGSSIPSSVTFEVATLGTFAGAVTVFSWVPTGGSSRYTGASATKYTGTGWCRLTFNFSPGDTAPAIAEIQLCERRQSSRRPNIGSGYDDQPYGSDIDRQSSRGRIQSNYLFSRGFSDFSGAFQPSGEDYAGLDDLTMLRAVAVDSEYLSAPVVWIDRPATALEFACFGFLVISGMDRGLELPYDDWQARGCDFRFSESSPFARRDNRISDT